MKADFPSHLACPAKFGEAGPILKPAVSEDFPRRMPEPHFFGRSTDLRWGSDFQVICGWPEPSGCVRKG